MTQKEKRQIDDRCRKLLSCSFGFKQRDYANWKTEKGFFFDISPYSKDEVALFVKPLYIDDLFWDIFDMAENKKEPVSLRATGAFVVYPLVYKIYKIESVGNSYTEEVRIKVWRRVFENASNDIDSYLKSHVDPEDFPQESDKKLERYNDIFHWLVLCHKGDYKSVYDEVKHLKDNHLSSSFINLDKDTNKLVGFNCFLYKYCEAYLHPETNKVEEPSNSDGLFSKILSLFKK